MRLMRVPFRFLKTCTVAPEIISDLPQWEYLAKLMFSSFQELLQLSRAIEALISLFHLLQCIYTFI